MQKPTQPSKRTVEAKQSFENLFHYIESSVKFEFNLAELKEALKPHSCYNDTLYKHLRDKYNNDILIIKRTGTQPVVFYKTVNLSEIATNFCTDADSLDELQKQTILTIARRILR